MSATRAGTRADTLFVIEAPGKRDALMQALSRLGISANVASTRGHFFDYPSGLDPLGITLDLEEPLRAPNTETRDFLREAAKLVDNVVLAMDDDDEGDAIAQDVFRVIRAVTSDIRRARFNLIEPDAIEQALTQSTPMRLTRDLPAVSRRVMDRLIGAGLSSNGIAVGRVLTPALAAIDQDPPVIGQAVLCARDEELDNRATYSASFDLCAQSLEQFQAVVKSWAEDVTLTANELTQAPPQNPFTYAEAVLAIHEAANENGIEVSLRDSAQVLQSLYEQGTLSYIRTNSLALSETSIAVVRRMAKRQRARWDDTLIKRFHPRQGPHEAIHPSMDVAQSTRIGVSLHVMSLPDLALQVVSRRLVQAGRPAQHHTATVSNSALEDVVFSRPAGPRNVRIDNDAPTSTHIRLQKDPAAIVLKHMIKHGLGTPSTQVEIATKIANEGLVNAKAELTLKGRHWLANAPLCLKDLQQVAQINKALTTPGEQSSDRVRQAIRKLDPDARNAVVDAIRKSNDEIGRDQRATKKVAELKPTA